MGPKVEAALRFLDEGGELAVITSPSLLAATLTGAGARRGTKIQPGRSRTAHAR
jgi:carbamate kinase